MRYHSHDPDRSRPWRVSTQGQVAVAPHFRVHEFACSDGTDVLLIHPALPDLLETIRAHFIAPVRISSGFRTHAHNEQIGGAETSRHLWGLAADITVDDVPPDTLADYAETLGVGGLGRYDSFTHVDVWGQSRRWDSRTP
jgi:uncharacterized protein YcbK (DUF882 family)